MGGGGSKEKGKRKMQGKEQLGQRKKPRAGGIKFKDSKDTSQPKSKATPPDGLLAVPLLKHQHTPEVALVTSCGPVFCNHCIFLTSDDNQCPTSNCKVHLSLSSVYSKATLKTSLSEGLESVANCSGSVLAKTLQPCSSGGPFDSSKIQASIEVLQTTVKRSIRSDVALHVSSGVFSTNLFDPELDCNELYYVKDREDDKREAGGTVINCYGEVIGILFYGSSFLPINIVLRWWKHFKSCGQYRRPWLGLEIVNLHSSSIELLEQFMIKFPNITAGVIVTKVAEDSPAACSGGIHPKDVIVACDGKLVRSKLEFFELLWDKVGESVELNIVRPSSGNELKVNVIVGEFTPDRFYHWPLIRWMVLG